MVCDIMVTTSKVEIDSELLNKVSRLAKDENTTEKKLITEAIEDILDKKEKNNEKTGFWSLGGKYKAGEPFSAVEEVRKMRGRE
jgi:hypothetical protein